MWDLGGLDSDFGTHHHHFPRVLSLSKLLHVSEPFSSTIDWNKYSIMIGFYETQSDNYHSLYNY